jgi:hydroxyacylglutathione hydrolase
VTDFTRAHEPPNLSVSWVHGQPRRSAVTEAPLQVHYVAEHTVVMRQNKVLTYEAPFLYLFLGDHTALLLDTGAVKDATTMPLRTTVDDLIDDWVKAHPRDDYQLVVAHSHGHADHVDGDAQFADRANTTVVSKGVASVMRFLGFSNWPAEVVELDLGGRQLLVTGCPGHHEASIAIYDPLTRLLLTGDTVYPGRLYVNDAEAFADSLDRLVALADQYPVSWVMGCHIEMTRTPGVDYPIGTRYQPDEPRLEMTVEQLRQVRDRARAIQNDPGVHVFDDVVIFNGRCITGVVKQLLRGNGTRLRELVSRA